MILSSLPPLRSRCLALLLLLGSLLLLPVAAAQTMPRPEGALKVLKVLGRAETQDSSNVWRPLSGAGTISNGLRTGTGRAILTNASGGQITIGSASQLRVYSQETDFQDGEFLMDGPVSAFTSGNHLAFSGAGRARIDVTANGSTKRIGVLSGVLRVANGNKIVTVSGGQQIDLKSLQVSPFRETDPWYEAQFIGTGEATVQALRGEVKVRGDNAREALAAQIGTELSQGYTLNCGAGAWAEVGFTGGGYLRLAEQSELKVLAVEKTSRGREITLQLTKGSAWNVVQKAQGGYKLSTPVVSTAVRGTKFRVDASGLVKVVEGQVTLPSDNGAVVSGGQQKQQNQPLAALQPDDLDRFNELLDLQRAQVMTLQVRQGSQVQRLDTVITTLPDTVVSAEVRAADGTVTPLPVTGDPVGGLFKASSTGDLTEGPYELLVYAKRFGQQLQWSRPVVIDRTPPVLAARATVNGRILTLSGVASDLPLGQGRKLKLTVRSGQSSAAQSTLIGSSWAVAAAFRILLPAPAYPLALELEVSDAAGNVSHVRLP